MAEHSKTLLVIDDDDINGIVLESLLKVHNIHCIQAENGRSGIQDAINFQPDVILLDIFMPDMNGFEILQQLKSNGKTKSIPVYIFSVLDNQVDIDRAYDTGALGYITKPFDMKDVVGQLLSVLL